MSPLTINIEQLWDQKYRDASVPFPIDGTAGGATSPVTSSTDGAVVQWSTAAGSFVASTDLPNAVAALGIGAAGGPPLLVRRSTNSTAITANTTLTNDDTLLWNVGANDAWFVDAFLMFTAADSSGASATEDLKVGWTVPTNGAMQWGPLSTPATGSSTWSGAATSATVVTLKNASNSQAFGAVAGVFGLALAGVYTGGGTAGTVHLQWAQNTSDASTLMLNANSFLRASRLA